jgi:hypothetical protein
MRKAFDLRDQQPLADHGLAVSGISIRMHGLRGLIALAAVRGERQIVSFAQPPH